MQPPRKSQNTKGIQSEKEEKHFYIESVTDPSPGVQDRAAGLSVREERAVRTSGITDTFSVQISV